MKLPRLLVWLVLAVVPSTTMSFQHRLLYFLAKTAVADMISGRLRSWPPAENFRGLMAELADVARATVVVFHDNAGHAGHRAFQAAALAPLGCG